MSEAQATEKSAILTVEAPANLDLESYIANYRGKYVYMVDILAT